MRQTALNSFQLTAPKSFHFVSPLRLFLALFEAERIVSGFQDIAMVGNVIEQGCGHFGIAKTVTHSAKDKFVVTISEVFS